MPTTTIAKPSMKVIKSTTKVVKSTCYIWPCPFCGVDVHLDEGGKIVNILGSKDHPHQSGNDLPPGARTPTRICIIRIVFFFR